MEFPINGDAISSDEGLEFEEDTHNRQMLKYLHLFHKKRQFCDAKLVVGATEIDVHRAVLAAASNLFCEMFLKSEEEGSIGPPQTVFKLKDMDPCSFQHLLNYMYTGRLEVPGEEVKGVYKCASQLKMESAASACSSYLATNLTPAICLGIRAIAMEEDFRRQINSFIEANISDVTESKNFYGLTTVQVEIIGADEEALGSSSGREIFELVLKWIRGQFDESNKKRLDKLTDQVNVLHLNKSNHLTDCADIDDENLKEILVAQDYKKQKRKNEPLKQKEITPNNSENGNAHFKKFHISPESPMQYMYSKEWSIVASYKTKDRTYMAIAMLNGTLTALSVHYQSPQNKPQNDPDSPKSLSPLNRRMSLSPLDYMSTPRCAFGLRSINGQLFACGGYDRGECLKSVEVYDIEKNKWSPLADLRCPRGRFSVAEKDGKIYAFGGSDGHQEVRSVECYDGETGKWNCVTSSPKPKASPGIAVLLDKIYVIGGSMGQSSVTDCETYDPAISAWANIAPLNLARFQVAVCGYMGKLFAVGGTNNWKCLNSTEIYDPESNTWQQGPPLNVCRRGAGISIFNGKLYVVGGNDGTSALSSTEIYDTKSRAWILGPALSMPRANAGVCSSGIRLYAVGGFDGKRFLDSMEYLDSEAGDDEWYSHLPAKLGDKNCEGQTGAYSFPDDLTKGSHMNGESHVPRNGPQEIVIPNGGGVRT